MLALATVAPPPHVLENFNVTEEAEAWPVPRCCVRFHQKVTFECFLLYSKPMNHADVYLGPVSSAQSLANIDG